MNSTEPPDVESTKRKNIIEMALGFTAMIRIFDKGCKKRIAEKLEEFFLSLAEIRNRDDHEVRHRSFCVWFMQNIRSAEKSLKNARLQPGGLSSYDRAAKVLDVAIKELDEEAYQALQSLLLAESLARKLQPVQYDDISWRRVNRDSSDAGTSER